MTLDEIVHKLKRLRDIPGKNDKEKFLSTHCDTDEFKYLLSILLDSKYALGLKKIGEVGCSTKETIRTYDNLKDIIDMLLRSNINDSIRDKVIIFLGGCTAETQDILKQFLQKTLKVGVTSKTLAKVFKGIIKEHPIALAKSPTEAVPQLPCIIGTKYDGIRYTQVEVEVEDGVVILNGQALTRDRNQMRFHNIEKGIQQLLKGQNGKWVIDGELESLDEDFDKIQGIVSSNISQGTTDFREDIKLIVFDIIRYSDFIGETKSKPQAERLKDLSKLFIINKPQYLVEAEHITVHSLEKIKEYTDEKINKGLEGSIIKDPKAPYKKGKTSAWIKQKAINDCTLKCIGVTEGTNKRAGKVGALMFESSDGLIKVNCGSGLTDEMVDLFTKTPPIGKFFDLLFNQVSQADNLQMSLRLPRLKGLRTDVVEADSFEKIKLQHIGAMKLKGDKDED